MFLISEIVCLLNGYFKENIFTEDQFHSAKYAGLTEAITYSQDEEKAPLSVPAEINENGEAEIITYNDTYGLQVYHKLNIKNNKLSKFQFGDTNKGVIDTYNLSLILIADRAKIKCGQSKLEYILSRMFPDAVKNQQNRIIAYVQPGNVDFNTKRIFSSEFQGVDFDSYRHFMIQVDYQIISAQYKRKCIDLCGTLPNTQNTIS